MKLTATNGSEVTGIFLTSVVFYSFLNLLFFLGMNWHIFLGRIDFSRIAPKLAGTCILRSENTSPLLILVVGALVNNSRGLFLVIMGWLIIHRQIIFFKDGLSSNFSRAALPHPPPHRTSGGRPPPRQNSTLRGHWGSIWHQNLL